jgi:signal recognition particle subunit SEC65
MSIESNKWLNELNKVIEELADLVDELGFDPAELEDKGEPVPIAENNKADVEYYWETKKKKERIEKKLEQSL